MHAQQNILHPIPFRSLLVAASLLIHISVPVKLAEAQDIPSWTTSAGEVFRPDQNNVRSNFDFGAAVALGQQTLAIPVFYSNFDGIEMSSGRIEIYERSDEDGSWQGPQSVQISEPQSTYRPSAFIETNGPFIIYRTDEPLEISDNGETTKRGQLHLLEKGAFESGVWAERKQLLDTEWLPENYRLDDFAFDGERIAALISGWIKGGPPRTLIFERNTGGPDNWGVAADFIITTPDPDFTISAQKLDIQGNKIAVAGEIANEQIVGAVGGGLVVYEQDPVLLDRWIPKDVVAIEGTGFENLSLPASVKLVDNQIFVGCPLFQHGFASNINHGAVFVFNYNIGQNENSGSWKQSEVLLPIDVQNERDPINFGMAIDVTRGGTETESFVVVSDPRFKKLQQTVEDPIAIGAGFIYQRTPKLSDDYLPLESLEPAEEETVGRFASAVAISGYTIAVGFDQSDGAQPSSLGEVQIYNLEPSGDLPQGHLHFERQPISSITPEGYRAMFFYEAAGVPPFQPRWVREDAPEEVLSEEHALILPEVTFNDEDRYRVEVTDATGHTIISDWTPLTLEVRISFEEILGNFLSEVSLEDRGFASDPDEDGIPNLVEYALGLDPAQADEAFQTAELEDGSMVYTFTLSRELTGLNVWIEISEDLALWETLETEWEIIEATETHTTYKVTIPAVAPTNYMRIQVERSAL